MATFCGWHTLGTYFDFWQAHMGIVLTRFESIGVSVELKWSPTSLLGIKGHQLSASADNWHPALNYRGTWSCIYCNWLGVGGWERTNATNKCCRWINAAQYYGYKSLIQPAIDGEQLRYYQLHRRRWRLGVTRYSLCLLPHLSVRTPHRSRPQR